MRQGAGIKYLAHSDAPASVWEVPAVELALGRRGASTGVEVVAMVRLRGGECKAARTWYRPSGHRRPVDNRPGALLAHDGASGR
jgi:hypothetical protein